MSADTVHFDFETGRPPMVAELTTTEGERVHSKKRCAQIQNRDYKQPARKVLEEGLLKL